jgi:glycine cleavage system aminomethyltransferase T
MAWLPAGLARDGASFEVRVEGGATRAATVVTRPFHDPEGARLRG